jgi:hypothetical protein
MTPPPRQHDTKAVAETARPIRIKAGRRLRLQVCTTGPALNQAKEAWANGSANNSFRAPED